MRLNRRGALMSAMNYTAPLSVARSGIAAAANGDALLFAGGIAVGEENQYFATVDAYRADFTRVLPAELSSERCYAAGASVDQYALIAGGLSAKSKLNPYYTVHSAVDAYNASLTRSAPTALSSGRYYPVGARVGSYALFAGGTPGSGGLLAIAPVNTVDAYNASLTRSIPTAMSVARDSFAGASVGNYALFAGGGRYIDGDFEEITTVNAYNASLTRSTPTGLSAARAYLSGASHATHAIFTGGMVGFSTYVHTVDAYNASLTRSTPAQLPAAEEAPQAARAGDYVVVARGVSQLAYAYDASLTLSVAAKPLSNAGQGMAAGTIGDSAFFAGGYQGDALAPTQQVNIYTNELRRFKSVH